MFNIGHIIPIICFWNSILKETLKYRQESTAKNIVHLIHSLIFILHHNYNYNIDYTIHISIGFYAYDLMYIISSILKLHLYPSLPDTITVSILIILLINFSTTISGMLFILNRIYVFK